MNYKPEKANFLASLALASLVKPFGINYARRPSSQVPPLLRRQWGTVQERCGSSDPLACWETLQYNYPQSYLTECLTLEKCPKEN